MKNIILLFFCLCSLSAISQSPEEKLAQLNMQLPEVPAAIGSYIDAVRVGNLIFLSGKGPRKPNGEYITGKLGSDLSVQEGYQAARLTALNQLAVLKKELGSLSKVRRIVKVNGFVNSASDFYDQPKVINGFSDLLIEIFGVSGKHARTSLGSVALPMNIAVEVEMIVEVEG